MVDQGCCVLVASRSASRSASDTLLAWTNPTQLQEELSMRFRWRLLPRLSNEPRAASPRRRGWCPPPPPPLHPPVRWILPRLANASRNANDAHVFRHETTTTTTRITPPSLSWLARGLSPCLGHYGGRILRCHNPQCPQPSPILCSANNLSTSRPHCSSSSSSTVLGQSQELFTKHAQGGEG